MSILLQVNHLSKSFGPRILLDDVTFSIAKKQKIGVIGRNGAGKSTLFRILVQEDEATSGEIQVHDGTRIGYLTQHDPYTGKETVMEFLQSSSGKPEWECAAMAGKFQLKNERLEAPIESLSGGYQMRVKLSAMLLKDPNLLLLDEPTNYLDLSTQILLEQFLQTYNGSFLVISHDREFLKNTCTSTFEIDQGKVALYPQDIESYFEHKARQVEMARRHNKKINKEKAHLQSFVDRFRFKASKASQAQSKLKQIEKLKTIDIVHPGQTTRIRIPPIEERKGIAFSSHEMDIGYKEKTIATNISIDLMRGEHIAIVGDNGQGKSTFLKTLAGTIAPLSGSFRWGPHIRVGYYAQHVQNMLPKTDTIQTYLQHMAEGMVKTERILEIAGNFLFPKDDLNKSISLLSGGEKARLCLAGLLLQQNEVLLLDEPTNHLDFETVEALAEALSKTNRTLLFISHNRTFVNRIATGIIEIQNGVLRRSHHDYESYVYHLQQTLEPETTPERAEPLSLHSRKELHQTIKKLKRELQAVEIELMELEKEKQQLIFWFETHPTEFSRNKTERLQDVTSCIWEKEKEWMQVQATLEENEKLL